VEGLPSSEPQKFQGIDDAGQPLVEEQHHIPPYQPSIQVSYPRQTSSEFTGRDIHPNSGLPLAPLIKPSQDLKSRNALESSASSLDLWHLSNAHTGINPSTALYSAAEPSSLSPAELQNRIDEQRDGSYTVCDYCKWYVRQDKLSAHQIYECGGNTPNVDLLNIAGTQYPQYMEHAPTIFPGERTAMPVYRPPPSIQVDALSQSSNQFAEHNYVPGENGENRKPGSLATYTNIFDNLPDLSPFPPQRVPLPSTSQSLSSSTRYFDPFVNPVSLRHLSDAHIRSSPTTASFSTSSTAPSAVASTASSAAAVLDNHMKPHPLPATKQLLETVKVCGRCCQPVLASRMIAHRLKFHGVNSQQTLELDERFVCMSLALDFSVLDIDSLRSMNVGMTFITEIKYRLKIWRSQRVRLQCLLGTPWND